MAKFKIEERQEWRWWVTPKLLNDKPIHRWYVFPHSFTSELVHALIDEWVLTSQDCILDPFVGTGTTLLAAREKSISADGYDLSPLSVFVTNTKNEQYDQRELKKTQKLFQKHLNPARWNGASKDYSDLIKKALPGRLLGAFDYIWRQIGTMDCSDNDKAFLKLSVLATLPEFSRAVATGGWLKWIERRNMILDIPKALNHRIDQMITDIAEAHLSAERNCHAQIADARCLPVKNGKYSAVITSPPYPNRHDYTRVFGVELMFAFQNWEENRQLRYQSFHSHPEARPQRPDAADYVQPSALAQLLAEIRKKADEPRIPSIIEGYFLDMHLCLKEVERVCRPGARIAFVLGNAQYYGVSIPVDEITAEIGEQIGLACEKMIVARYRGNSAQQMKLYGVNPSRETVVIFKK